MTTHDFLDFDAIFALYPTYCLLPAAMKPSRTDWENTTTTERDARKVRCFRRGLVGRTPRPCGSATRRSIGIKEVSKYDTSFFDSRRVGPLLIADWDFQPARLGKSKLIRKLPGICLQGHSLKAVAFFPLLPIARPMWLPVAHPFVLPPFSPRPISPPARQDPAVVAHKLCICVRVRPSASLRNPESTLSVHAECKPVLRDYPRKRFSSPLHATTRRGAIQATHDAHLAPGRSCALAEYR